MTDVVIQSLKSLNNLRTAPKLTSRQELTLYKELVVAMRDAEWFTVGIMAPSAEKALNSLRAIESLFNWSPMKVTESPNNEGPVFLKANQKTSQVHIRIEHGLGEGILLCSQHSDSDKSTCTWGPLPLNFFNKKIS